MAARPQTKLLIDSLSPLIVTLNIEPQPANVWLVPGCSLNVLKESPKDAAPAMICMDIDALEPPQNTVAPIGQFQCDHRLADHTAVRFRDKVPAKIWLGERPPDATRNRFAVQRLVLGFLGQPAVEIDDC